MTAVLGQNHVTKCLVASRVPDAASYAMSRVFQPHTNRQSTRQELRVITEAKTKIYATIIQ
jgi:hypothetical protein